MVFYLGIPEDKEQKSNMHLIAEDPEQQVRVSAYRSGIEAETKGIKKTFGHDLPPQPDK